MPVAGLRALREQRASGNEPLVGAAIGVGMTAEAAERGGADFLLALSAGRYRVMGAASVAAMLPLADANAFTDCFARREILDRVRIPVFFGAAAFQPRLDLDRLAAELAEAGYHGIANFPTSIHYDGRFRQALEEAGLGFGREVGMLVAGRRAGLATFGYAKTKAEIALLLEAEIDIVCVNFGWNAGGLRGLAGVLPLDEVANRARRVLAQIRQVRPETVCVVEGGPIVSPEDMYRVYRDARADGYVGGSTVDRVPLELSVIQITSAFKTVSALRGAVAERRKETSRAARIAGIAGHSGAILALLDRIVRLAATSLPVLIVGEPGSGKTSLARALHGLGARAGPLIVVDADDRDGVGARLFGAEPSFGRSGRSGALETPNATVVLEGLEKLPAGAQAKMIDWLDRGEFERVGGARSRRADARLVVTASERIDAAAAAGGFRRELLARLQPGRVDVPPVRDRLEDIPLHAREILDAIGARRGARLEVSPDGYRALGGHSWPNNMRELRTVLEQAAVLARGPQIGSSELAAAIGAQPEGVGQARPPRELDWILDGLRRNRFRRAETAAFLGIARKTLYNKMKRYGLLD